MCGIFGYVGTEKQTAERIFQGLKLLEYRGYDSWGIAVSVKGKIVLAKHIGKIGNATIKLPESTFGIGHTRWATHGGVTVKNAHPHVDCNREIAIVHNGIIENYTAIKKDLISQGHIFSSDTDTEVFAHLVEEHCKNLPFAKAVQKAFGLISGLNAIVATHAPSAQIVAVKTGSPLVIGKTNKGFYIASDSSGILKHTRQMLFLKDNELVVLGKNITIISTKTGKRITSQFQKISWKIEDISKGKYKHFMLKEIHEQPTVLRLIANEYQSEIQRLVKLVKNAQGTFFIGAGTAYHACLTGSYLFSKISHIHVNTAPASEFNYLEDFLTHKSLIIALSQSGETIDVVEPVRAAKEKGSTIVGIVNVLGSTIYRMSDQKLLLGAGPERAVASTKAYVAKLSVLLLLAYAMIGKEREAKDQLLQVADVIELMFQKDQQNIITRIAKMLSKKEHLYVIGRGSSYPSALEAALKIKEVSYLHTEGLAGGELKHGAIALIEKGTPCLVFAPNDDTQQAIISNAMEIKARGGVIIGISAQHNDTFNYWIPVPDVKDATVIAQIVPAQLLAYFLALQKGFDPDKPRNLAKSVTVK